MVICKRCNKENQDHYKFCLGCGEDLSRSRAAASSPGAVAASAVAAATGPTGGATSNRGSFSLPPATAPVGKSQSLPGSAAGSSPAKNLAKSLQPLSQSAKDAVLPVCPGCGHQLRTGFLFCGNCGKRLDDAPSNQSAAVAGAIAASVPMAAPKPHARLVLLRSDGTEAGWHPIAEGTTLLGRGQAPLLDSDPFLSPRHAEVTTATNGLTIRPLRSLNGIFLKVTAPVEITSGAVFRVGQELLRFDALAPPQPTPDGTLIMGSPNPGFWGRIVLVLGQNLDGTAYPLSGEGAVIGRERGEILFPEDGYVSGAHLRVAQREGRVWLEDLGSSNGTFVRLQGETLLQSGAVILMGQQLFRVDLE